MQIYDIIFLRQFIWCTIAEYVYVINLWDNILQSVRDLTHSGSV